MPKAVVTDGYTLDEYIPLYLRDMFYKSSYPEATFNTTNGYGPYDFSTQGLVLYLPLWALDVSGNNTFKSVDAYQHTCTQVGALYKGNSHWFDGGNDKITVPDHASLDIAVNITIIMVITADTINWTEADTLVQKGGRGGATSEYCFYTNTTDDIVFGAAFGVVPAWASHEIILNIVQDTPTFIAVTYDGTNVIGYKETTAISSAQTGNMVTGANDISIMGLNGFLDGFCHELWVYNRTFPATELAHHRNTIMWRYQ